MRIKKHTIKSINVLFFNPDPLTVSAFAETLVGVVHVGRTSEED